jgi:hypothetical protein
VFSSLLCERLAKPCARFWHQLLSLMLAPALGPAPLLEYGLPGATGRTHRSGRQNWLLAHCSVVKEPSRSCSGHARGRDTVERNRHSRVTPASQDRVHGHLTASRGARIW